MYFYFYYDILKAGQILFLKQDYSGRKRKSSIGKKGGDGLKMNTNIKNEIEAADNKAQYDARAKRLLGNKYILAYILKETITEFKGEKIETILSCIERDVQISSAPVDLGETNRKEKRERIIGDNTEDNVPDEGIIYFDILFHARLPEKKEESEKKENEEKKKVRLEIIVNVEAQKANPSHYQLPNRAVFYACRMVSSQKTREFDGSDFDSILRVYSIWICMNMPEDALHYVHLTDNCILGQSRLKGGLDLLNIFFVELARNVPNAKTGHKLHRLLGTLFSKKLKIAEKQKVIHEEYGIPLESGVEEEASIMCNLSEWIEEEALERGRAIGEAQGRAIGEAQGEAKLILNLHKKGYTAEQIADMTDKSMEEIMAILEQREPLPV